MNSNKYVICINIYYIKNASETDGKSKSRLKNGWRLFLKCLDIIKKIKK